MANTPSFKSLSLIKLEQSRNRQYIKERQFKRPLASISQANSSCNAGFAADPSVATLAVQHLQIRAFAAPAVMVLLVVNGAFRGFRDTK